MRFFKTLIFSLLLLSSCEATNNHPVAESNSFTLMLWVTRVDVCHNSLPSSENTKVLFVVNEGMFGFALNENEKLVLVYSHLYEDPTKTTIVKIFYSHGPQEPYCVDMRINKDGILIFVSPLVTKQNPCENKINTTAYIFSSHEPKF